MHRRTRCKASVPICATLQRRVRSDPRLRSNRSNPDGLPMQRALGNAMMAGRVAPAVFVLALVASSASASDALAWLTRASQAARQLNYVGTIVYQIGPRVETSRITH